MGVTHFEFTETSHLYTLSIIAKPVANKNDDWQRIFCSQITVADVGLSLINNLEYDH